MLLLLLRRPRSGRGRSLPLLRGAVVSAARAGSGSSGGDDGSLWRTRKRNESIIKRAPAASAGIATSISEA